MTNCAIAHPEGYATTTQAVREVERMKPTAGPVRLEIKRCLECWEVYVVRIKTKKEATQGSLFDEVQGK